MGRMISHPRVPDECRQVMLRGWKAESVFAGSGTGERVRGQSLQVWALRKPMQRRKKKKQTGKTFEESSAAVQEAKC